MKNFKPRTIAFYASLLLAAITSLACYLVGGASLPWAKISIICLAVFIAGFIIFLYLIEQFIYRRIKVIYKAIHSLKLGKDLKDAMGESIGDDPLNDVESEVAKWASDKRTELDEMRRLEKYRKEFLANLSHELKTPLFSIQGYLHTLNDGALDDGEVNYKFIQKSITSTERLVNLVADLEEITKIEQGEVALNVSSFDINKLVKEVFNEMEVKAAQHQIEFGIKKGTDTEFMVLADREKIRQVLINLVDNSIKYGNPNTSTIASFYDMGDNIMVEITDEGKGIAEHHLPRLFERFYRVDHSRDRGAGGTGLGLAIVKHIIEAHNQTVHVRSTLNIGSTFGFTLQKASSTRSTSRKHSNSQLF